MLQEKCVIIVKNKEIEVKKLKTEEIEECLFENISRKCWQFW